VKRETLEKAHPWLCLFESVEQDAVLLKFQLSMGLPSMGPLCRVLGQESYLRGDALILKRYLSSTTPNPREGHFIYRAPGHPEVLIAVSLNDEKMYFRLVGAPPDGSFWDGDFEDGPPENPRHLIRRNKVGDRFVTKSAGRTEGQGFESETVLTFEPSETEDAIILRTEVNDFLPDPRTTIRRAVVKQSETGAVYEFGPLGEEFDNPVLSRRSPMVVGQYYSTLYCFSDLCCEEHVAVESFEGVVVPAGNFQAFRLRLQSPLPERLGWFVPELGVLVKETVSCDGHLSMSLLHEYTLV
jgi:hypothetical protein